MRRNAVPYIGDAREKLELLLLLLLLLLVLAAVMLYVGPCHSCGEGLMGAFTTMAAAATHTGLGCSDRFRSAAVLRVDCGALYQLLWTFA